MYFVSRNQLAILLLASIFLLVIAFPVIKSLKSPQDLVRIRNALVAKVGTPEDFHWKPDSSPSAFHHESGALPEEFSGIASMLAPSNPNAIDQMQNLVAHLRSKPKQQGPIKEKTTITYSEILSEGRGYCADYTQVFNGLAYAVDLPVREWGMSFDSFGGDGHAFNEVYDRDLEQWVFIDPMHAFYVVEQSSGRPLSVLEFRDHLVSEQGTASLEVVPVRDAFLFDSAEEAFEYYGRGADQFFLWMGNDVFTYDEHPAVKLVSPYSRSLEQLVAIAFQIHPELRLYPTESNSEEITALVSLRKRLFTLAFLSAAILAAFLSIATSNAIRAARKLRVNYS